MKRAATSLRTFVCAVIAILGWSVMAAAPTNAVPALPSTNYAYNSHHHADALTYATTERGPPTAYDHATFNNAVGDRSNGESARRQVNATPVAFAYDHLAAANAGRVFTSADAHVADAANAIEAALPGRVIGVNGQRAMGGGLAREVDIDLGNLPPRVAALRRNSLEIVDGLRPSTLAIARTPLPVAFKIAISSRSASDRECPDGAGHDYGDIPPDCRNHRDPATGAAPTAIPASVGSSPVLVLPQNSRSFTRECEGAPGERTGARPVTSFIQSDGLPTTTLRSGVASTG